MAACIALLGCANVDVAVNAYLASGRVLPSPAAGDTVAVLTTTEPPEPLLADEISRKVEYLLGEHGYATADEQDAGHVLFCFAAIDAGRTRKGVTPVHEPGKTIESYYYGRGGRYAVKRTYIPGKTRYIPYEYTLYTRSLALELCDRERLEQAEEGDKRHSVVWRCTAISSGPESDLRWIVNHLLLTAFEHFGRDTEKQQHMTICYEDERVKDLAEVARAATAD
jgi:hypothetical protein